MSKTASYPKPPFPKQGRWVRGVAETSNAMDLEAGVFTRSPKEIALSLRRSVLASPRTKGTKFQSAMSMLNFYMNRAGRSLGPRQRARLEKAKAELRKAFAGAPRDVMEGRMAKTIHRARKTRRTGKPRSSRRALARRAREAIPVRRTLL